MMIRSLVGLSRRHQYLRACCSGVHFQRTDSFHSNKRQFDLIKIQVQDASVNGLVHSSPYRQYSTRVTDKPQDAEKKAGNQWNLGDLIEDRLDYRNYDSNLPKGLFYLTADRMNAIFKEGEVDGYLKKLKDMGIKTLQHLKPLLVISDDSQKAQDTREILGDLRIDISVLLSMIRDTSAKLRTTINPPKAYNVNITRTPIYGLEKQYNSTMKCSTALLFKSWENYKSSLPQRKWSEFGGRFICLAENEYWAREKDLDLMVDSLFQTRDNKRTLIKYISAPSESGKTSSAAAAFVRSTQNRNETKQFSYYLYIACNNNNGRDFRYYGWVSQDKQEAEKQGAQFAFECVEKLLNMEELEPKKKVSPAKSIDDASKRIADLLEEKNIQGRVLFHLDEHKKMCGAPNFRRGAMSALAKVENATLLSTFTSIPFEIPSDKTSAVCRQPVACPMLDISLVVEGLNQLKFPIDPTDMSIKNKRLYATLIFRLGFYLSKKLNIIHINTVEEFETFKSEFHQASEAARQMPNDDKVVRSALGTCLQNCKPLEWSRNNSTSLAASLLVGIQEDDYNGKLPFTVAFRSLGNVYFTSPLNKLLDKNLPRQEQGYSAFSKGRFRFLAFLWGEIDIISGTPLECAYAWTLCVSAIANQEIQIPNNPTAFSIKCDKLEPGRLFDTSSIGSFSKESANNLDIHTIYFAKEGSGSQSTSHPICDIFFRTEANELVMIDVTGSASKERIEKKINQKRDFLEQHTHNIFQLHCFVLAPLYDGKYDGNGSSMLVSGENARHLLGGLAPILSWYNEDWEKDDVIEI